MGDNDALRARLSRLEREMALRTRIAELFLTISGEDIYSRVLQIVREALDSRNGVFAYIDEDGALTVPTTQSRLWEERKTAEGTHRFSPQSWHNSIWARAITEQRVLYSNARESVPSAELINAERCIAAPIVHRGEAIGLLHVTDKPTDYTDADIELMSQLADLLAPILHARLVFERQEQRRTDAETALQEYARALERSNRDLEQFAYVASHDLQEPLRMVASYTQLLAERYGGELDEKADKYIGYAVEGARRMQRLINDLLAFSRVGTRGRPFALVDVDAVLAQTLQRMERTIEESGARIELDPMPTILGDELQLGQVFQNLIANAIKYCGEREPRIAVTVEEAAEEWRFAVCDNGIGIESKYHERVFVIFQRLQRRDDSSGSGIGLSIAKKIVERHGGQIGLDSTPGEGTTVWFRLPKEPPKESIEYD